MSKPLRELSDLRGYGSAATMESLAAINVKTLADLIALDFNEWRTIANVTRAERRRIYEAKVYFSCNPGELKARAAHGA